MNSNLLTWVEISRGALINNIRAARQRVGKDVKIMAIVKANAYGHGLIQVATTADEEKVDFFGVNSLHEAIALRNAKIKTPVLVLGYTPLANLKDAVNHDVAVVAYNVETVNKLQELAAKYKKDARIHIKVETGLHRQGVNPEELDDFLKLVKSKKNVIAEGMSTHYANIEDTTEHSYANLQVENFNDAFEAAKRAGLDIKYRHTACTAATILFSKVHFEMIRFGIGLYGMWPSKETKISAYERKIGEFNLVPVLTWKTRVAQVKDVPPNSYIGYGCSDFVTQKSRIAILPIGYYDGYDRKLSNVGYVLIHGKRAPILGRICMNMCIVDITNIEGVIPEDEVILLGSSDDDAITAETMASKIGTINYEVVTRINESLPRILVN
ncbi:MAG TPA: alanine racemase [Candidatus Wallbacteria bacterium]|nr:alanine racemase [Candidatus Wallbacteria bacterium]